MAALLMVVGGIVVGHGAVTFPVCRFALVRFQDLLWLPPSFCALVLWQVAIFVWVRSPGALPLQLMSGAQH
jgi:hypothetical protein